MTGSEYYHRRKQPRQSKNSMSLRDQNNELDKKSESDEEVDIIPKEVTYRQPVHETKSTLQLKNLRLEGSPKIVIPSSECISGRADKASDEHYKEFMQFEPHSHSQANIYNPIRKITPEPVNYLNKSNFEYK